MSMQSRSKRSKYKGDHLAWPKGNEDPMHEVRIPCTRCVSHRGYLGHGNSKGEARGRSRLKNNSKRVVRDMETRKVGNTKRQLLNKT